MINELNPIRFALCMMIFCHHAYLYSAGGAPAVSAFFILSGFCLTIGYKEKILSESFDYLNYLKIRIIKIYPIHWITLLFVLVMNIIGGEYVFYKKILLTNILLLHSWIPDQSYYFSYNMISWYLSTAMFSYMCFPMIITMLHKIQLKQRIGLLVAILLGYGVVAYAMPKAESHAMLYIHPVCRSLDFVIGIYLAELYASIKIEHLRNYNWLFDIGLIVSFAALNIISMCTPEDLRPIAALFWIPACAMILFTCLASRTQSPLSKFLSSNVMQKITICSFSMMMWSICLIQVAGAYEMANRWHKGVLLFFGVYVVAMISYWLIEKKLTKWIINKICTQQ